MADYRLDFAAFGQHVLNAGWMVEEMRRRTEAGKVFAESISPYDVQDNDGRHYRDGFETDAHTHGGVHKDRAEGVLRNVNEARWFVEFGARHTPEYAVLRKALDVMGS